MDDKISVIVSTYNRYKALERVLEGLDQQIDTNFEIIIADDGSDDRTRYVVEEAIKKSKIKIKYIWQEDQGFRLAKIRNLAVKHSEGEYLIFLDGDCIPPPNFIKNHRKLAENGWAVLGQRILASKSFSAEIEFGQVKVGRDFFYLYRIIDAYIHSKTNRWFPALEISIRYMRKLQPTNWEKVRGCNFALWKSDYININGSDECFLGWGSEDKDLAVRLINNGIKLKDGRNFVWVLHLWHKENNKERDKINMRIVKERFLSREIYPEKGMHSDVE